MEKLINNVIEFVIKLSEVIFDVEKSKIQKYKHIDIELIKEDKLDWVQITHCSLTNLYHSDWIDVLCKAVYQSSVENTSTLIFFKSNHSNYEFTYNLHQLNQFREISSIIRHPHLKEYLGIKIEHKLRKEEFELFKINLPQELSNLNKIYPNLKYTLQCDDRLLYNNLVSLDEIFNQCHLLSSAIEKVIISSINDEFRLECSKLLDTMQSGNLNSVMTVKLFELFNNNYEFKNNR